MRRIELDVRRAQAHQLVDLLAQDLGDVAEELLQARVGTARALGIPEVGEQARARQRHLEDAVGAGTRIGELVGREEAPPAKLPLHGDRRPLDLHLAELAALPLPPQERVEIPLAEPLDRLGHLALEREPAHLAIRDDGHPRLLLEPERGVDGRVLRLLQPVASSSPRSNRSRASSNSGGRSRLPTTSERASSTRPLYATVAVTRALVRGRRRPRRPSARRARSPGATRADASLVRPRARSISARASRTSEWTSSASVRSTSSSAASATSSAASSFPSAREGYRLGESRHDLAERVIGLHLGATPACKLDGLVRLALGAPGFAPVAAPPTTDSRRRRSLGAGRQPTEAPPPPPRDALTFARPARARTRPRVPRRDCRAPRRAPPRASTPRVRARTRPSSRAGSRVRGRRTPQRGSLLRTARRARHSV